ncbi:glycosyltransferase [Pseudozyma hubeiensis SY62]|uniref:Sterol 3-beta-glucosyltransferase n=1 Tax=Pseudozyma hubeiensis (strain SY62) TaxID=1305764 RepID=R9NX60_PSEHS|nr:glycosyltransferase [Pseudozyma hubeiensis SY62]GAC93146.1 glycosyltransferase [Pseudozyma hubeiensis SY62]
MHPRTLATIASSSRAGSPRISENEASTSTSQATQPNEADLDPFTVEDEDGERPQVPPPVQVPVDLDTPPLPTSPRLDPWTPRDISTISSLAGSRELGRPALEPITRIFAPNSASSQSARQSASTVNEPAVDVDQHGVADVAFHAEPQGLMQMLSLVGSTFFDADGEGYREDDEEESEQPSYQPATASTNLYRQTILDDAIGDSPTDESQPHVSDHTKLILDRTAKGRLQALARDDVSDDGSTPQGSRSPLDASVATIGPKRSKRTSLTHSEIISSSRDSTATRTTRRPGNPRSHLHNVASASMFGSTSKLAGDADDDQHGSRSIYGSSPPDQGSTDTQQARLSQQPSVVRLPSDAGQPIDRDSDPLLIRPYQTASPSRLATVDVSDSARIRLLHQLKEIFQLDTAETLLLAQPCWLFRSLLLQGHLYLTSSHVCFYAYLPSRDEKTVKTGLLGKRTRRTHRFSKHWASLKGGKLSWHDSDRDPYFPQGHIDLRKVSAVEPSTSHKDRFKVTTPARRFTFLAEDEHSRDAWVTALQKETFRAQNQGDSVRISIPLETVMNVETTLSVEGTEMVCITVVDEAGDFSVDEYYFLHLTKPSAFISGLTALLDQMGRASVASLQGGDQALNLSRLSIRDSTGATHATSISRKSLEEVPVLAKVLVPSQPGDQDARRGEAEGTKISQTEPAARAAAGLIWRQSADQGDESTGSASTAAAAVAIPVSVRGTSQEGSTDAVLSTTPRAAALKRLSTESSHTYPPSPSASDPPSSFDDVQKEAERGWAIPDWLKAAPARVLGRVTDSTSAASPAKTPWKDPGTRRRRRVLEKWSDEKGDDVSRGESSNTDNDDDTLSHSMHSTQSSYSILDADDGAAAAPDHTSVAAEFRDTFGVGDNEGLIGHTHAYLYRVLPIAGRFFVGEHHLAFRSSGIAAKTVGRTLMLVPLQEVISAAKHVAFRPGHHGMVINISGHEELFIEIASAHRRDELLSLIEYQLELLRGGRGSRASRESATRERSHALVLRDLSERIHDGAAATSLASSADSSMLSPTGSALGGKSSNLSQLGEGSSVLSFAPTAPLTFTMLTIGSRGDVQPYIALAKGLLADGHRVRIATHAEFGDWILGHGIEFSEIGGDPAELMRICVENGTFTVSFLREGVTRFRDWLDDLLASAWRACQGSDVIIECPSAIAGIHVAEALQVPYFRAFTMPWTRTRAYPHAFAVPNKKAGGNYNYMSYVIFDQMFWRASAFQINRWRKKQLGLQPTNFDKLEQHKVPFIYNFSPSLVPRPLDWFEWIHVTGFWFLDNPDNSESKKWEPPGDLVAFIKRARDRRRKVVYIGWGSIVVPDAVAMTKCVLQAVEKSGVCAILSKGWSDRLSSDRSAATDLGVGEDVYQVTSVPHDWLFPQIDAACHHGGAGTLGASLRAGLPTVVKPYFGDQFFWGQQIESLGVGSCVRHLTVDTLAQALIKATSDKKQIERARRLGEQIRGEDGVGTAVKVIYRDLEYARGLVKKDTRIEGSAKGRNVAESGKDGGLEVEKTQEEDEGHTSDEWSDIGGGEFSPRGSEGPSSSLILG